VVGGHVCATGLFGDGSMVTGVKSNNVTTTVTSLANTTYTLQACDSGSIIKYTGTSATTITIPTNIMNNGDQVTLLQGCSGAICVLPASGVTRNAVGNATKTTSQHAVAGLIKTGTNEWLLVGDVI
jgi:hypothetical protein